MAFLDFEDYPKDKCGIVVAYSYSEKNVIPQIYNGMMALQHRGQDGYGACTFDGLSFHKKKGRGLVPGPDEFLDLSGRLGIGHVRYTTAGESPLSIPSNESIEDFVQPVEDNSVRHGIRLGFNGNIINFIELKDLFRHEAYITSETDAGVIVRILANELSKKKNLNESITKAMEMLDGAYSVVAITGLNEMIAFMDPLGVRPLCYGSNDELEMIASESVALDVNHIKNYRMVEPGELIVINPGMNPKEKIDPNILVRSERHAHCMFERVYIARPDSTLEGGEVYGIRKELGRKLAKRYPTNAEVIVPVPDTARPGASGISEVTGIPDEEGLIKNRYVPRTFIMPKQASRENSVDIKLNPVKGVIRGKRVVIVDDSLVRGTTMRKIVNKVKEAGATYIEVWLTCPPPISPCYYGINMKTHEELAAANHSLEEIRIGIGADKLNYQTVEDLVEALGLPKEELCLGCLTGKYPTPSAQRLADEGKMKLKKEIVLESRLSEKNIS
ncbi:MAG: amidophosphoribosyltransferase [Candidatus Aenigmatarchaeota archaeon]